MKVKQKRESKQSSDLHSSKMKSNISPLLAYYSSKQSISHYSEMNYLKAIHHTLLNRYSIKSKDFISFQIKQLLDNKKTHLVALFKDNMISNSKEEYLKREYNRKESIERIPKFVKYYKNYLLFFCKPTFSNFRFNNIIQLSSRRSAQVYYGINYAKNNKKDKKEAKVEYMKVFSLSVREAINNNQSNMIKNIKKDRITCRKDNDKKIDESTIQLTFIEGNTLKEGGHPLKENDSMISLVNLINNNNFNQKANSSKRNIENNLRINSKNNNVNTVLDKKELLKQSIEDKPTNQVKNKLKFNQQPKDNKCNQLVTEINKNYLNTESSSKIDKPKINNNIYQNTEPHHPNHCLNFNVKGQLKLKTKIKHVRKALSTLPNATTTEGNKTNMKMYSTPYPTINTSQNANGGIKYLSPSAFSPKIQTKNNLTSSSNNKEGVYGKTMSHFHHKEISMMTKNEYNTIKTKAKATHRARPSNIFPFTNAVYSSFNNYDKQQQILNSNNNNMKTISKGTSIISISKEIRHKNSRYDSETLKSVNDCSIRRNNTKSFKYNNNTISNTNTNTDTNPITNNNNNNKANITNEPLKAFLRIRKQKKSHN